ncbi:MAG: type II toxin-antitoxin system PemK/MazF family toxin [Gemmatimonadota bacterium]|nr:type II toxin-antitoxin system PemK/MazF family toxin [Gemmatimonadota bacterium]
MVEVAQGEIWWADLPGPTGSAAGFRRPVVIVQGNPLNRSRLATVVCVPLTSNLTWEAAPGNTFLPARLAGLPKDSVANATQLFAVDRTYLGKRIGKLTPKRLEQILTSIDVVLGR